MYQKRWGYRGERLNVWDVDVGGMSVKSCARDRDDKTITLNRRR